MWEDINVSEREYTIVKDLYSIGEVSKIMGVSIQTLRYYDSIHLLAPKYINPSSGYRYYAADQLHFIDRIKYLQKFSMSLDEIKEIIEHNDIEHLVVLLEKQKKACEEEISRLRDTVDSIEWYKNYFKASEEELKETRGYEKQITSRYMVYTPILEGEPREDYHIRLNQLKNNSELKDLVYLRQFSLILDYDALTKGELKRKGMGMFIKEPPSFESEYVMEIPAGNYFCVCDRILSEDWNPYMVRMFFNEMQRKPTLVIANEFEDSLSEYSRCVYEIQALIPKE